MATHLLTLTQLRDLSRDAVAAAGFSPLDGGRCLLFAVGPRALPVADTFRVAQWLRRLPCPVLGVFPARGHALLRRSCDVVLGREADAELPVRNIEASPITAAVLVQLLRSTERQPVADALVAESLAYSTLQAGPEFRRWLGQRKPEPAPAADPGPAVALERGGDSLSIELNRPSNRNALSVEMRDALNEAFALVLADASIKSVGLSGRGKCFSVGGDLAEFGSLPDPATGHAIRSLTMPGHLLARIARRVHARVHGACIGSGVELPAFARRVTAHPDTYFHMPELRLGLIPGGGGCVSIPRRIGRQRTAAWVLSGKRINAAKALEWGLVDEIAA